MSLEIPPAKIANLLKDLFGRPVDFDTAPAPDLADNAPRWAAVYGTGGGGLMVVCVCNLEFAAFAGAALSMIPVGAAKEGIQAKHLESSMIDNLHEVFNIFGQLFRGRLMDTVTLCEVSPLADLSPVAKALLGKPAQQTNLEFSIEGYGDGRLSLFS
jgi:hypothetical protein